MSDREAFKATGVSLSVALSRDDVMALMDFATKIRAEARDAALEEAAQACESRLQWIAGPGSGDMRYQVQQCAAAIRAMAEGKGE